MRPTQLLLNQAKKSSSVVPLELTPLFIAMGAAVASASYFTYKKFAHDRSLRITKNPELSEVQKAIDSEKSQ
ncbi:hypothetical protein ZYGR_0P01100 [Zygosaccharomyces rouxii]|uniref:ZYRO0E02750p n=2 Tax=Zygosaccharomyces rouxii TaxID=4956 RepID=C5E447_ZYGRC|nr:uncharacterized protein ZYRO0E02750g [Zygosaccharomyces rouxii]GAV49466.1 hypothetical protein ZYGR_0P01100 [Zygosaccharomyces rouxii]CAR30808.1 ZYRO0E02750p [Zygosaccharomyces rouxii]